jgi:integrase
MALYKRGSVWWMSFTHNGQQFRRSTETEDKKLATRIFDKLKGEIAEGKWFEKPEGEHITFCELMDKYMSDYSAINKAPRSYERDQGLRKNLEPVFGKMFLTEITPRQIAEYKVKRRKEGASPRTVNYELTLMGHAFNLALREWGMVRENPVSKVRKETVNNLIERWLTFEEEAKLLEASQRWLREIIVFAIHTGFRESEILDLTWKQVDFNRRTITLFEQKNKKVDTLPINQTVLEVLERRYEETQGKSTRVFVNKYGKRILSQNLIRSFHAAIKRAGIEKLRFHDLRHTFATRLVQNGVDLYSVQKLGRWKTTSMIVRYAHHYPESLRPSIETMDRNDRKVITNLSQSQKK